MNPVKLLIVSLTNEETAKVYGGFYFTYQEIGVVTLVLGGLAGTIGLVNTIRLTIGGLISVSGKLLADILYPNQPFKRHLCSFFAIAVGLVSFALATGITTPTNILNYLNQKQKP